MSVTQARDEGIMRYLTPLGSAKPNPVYNEFNSDLDTIDKFIEKQLEK
jgi:hypothetical protein